MRRTVPDTREHFSQTEHCHVNDTYSNHESNESMTFCIAYMDDVKEYYSTVVLLCGGGVGAKCFVTARKKGVLM
jgi:ribose 5-phosphate isomerase RpiB